MQRNRAITTTCSLRAVLVLLMTALGLTTISMAQDCTKALNDAEQQYLVGRFDRVISTLTPCLDQKKLNDEGQKQAYRLIGLSYIGKDLQSEARDAIKKLLELVPNYQPDPAEDPPQLIDLVKELRSEKRNRAPEIDRRIGDLTLSLGQDPLILDAGDYFTDPDSDELKYEVSVVRSGVVSAVLAGGEIRIKPTGAGETILTLKASDDEGASIQQEIVVTVRGTTTTAQSAPKKKSRKWIYVAGGLAAGGIAAAVLLGGGGGSSGTPGGNPIGDPPALPLFGN